MKSQCTHEETMVARTLEGDMLIICLDCRNEVVPVQPSVDYQERKRVLQQRAEKSESDIKEMAIEMDNYRQRAHEAEAEVYRLKRRLERGERYMRYGESQNTSS